MADVPDCAVLVKSVEVTEPPPDAPAPLGVPSCAVLVKSVMLSDVLVVAWDTPMSWWDQVDQRWDP